MTRVFLLLLTLLPALGLAENATLISAGALLDVETGELLDNPVVLVQGEKILAINPESPPADATRIDLPGMTLLPGFMDAHVHLAISDAGFHQLLMRENTASATLRAVESARQTLLGGFTTVRDLGQVNPSLELIIVALAQGIEAGRVIGPDVIASGHAIGVTGGHVDPTLGFAEGVYEVDWRNGIADGVDEMVKATRYQVKHGAKVIKISATAGVLSFEDKVGAQQMTAEEMQAVVAEARRHGIRVAAHAHGAEGIKAAVAAGVASIEHGSMVDGEAMGMMKKRGTYLVPTTGLLETMDLTQLPDPLRTKAEGILPVAARNLSEAIRRDVPIALGTDAPLVPHGDNALEFVVMVERGMTPLQSLQSGTINTAQLFGLADRGKLEAGLRADIVAVPGNPLEDIDVVRQVGFVMKAGKVYRHPLL